MKNFKRIVSVIIIAAMLVGFCSINTFAAKKISKIKIVNMPNKTSFYQDSDWIYGEWETSETVPGKVTKVSSDKISFTHNPGGGAYPDRGMLDMTGLKIEVTYSDGSKSTIDYQETLNKSTGFYYANILFSPQKSYAVGTNTIEVYLQQDTSKYATYDINIIAGKAPVSNASGDVNGDKKVNSQDALLVLQHSVNLITLTATQKTNADMDGNGKINSTDALMILRKATA